MSGQIETASNEAAVESPGSEPANAAQQIVESVTHVRAKPRFLDWIHVYSVMIAVLAGAALVAVSWAVASTCTGLATFAYNAALLLMFAVSAT